MSIGKRCVFQLSSISIRILSHSLILRLGYFNFLSPYAISQSPQRNFCPTTNCILAHTLVPSVLIILCRH